MEEESWELDDPNDDDKEFDFWDDLLDLTTAPERATDQIRARNPQREYVAPEGHKNMHFIVTGTGNNVEGGITVKVKVLVVAEDSGDALRQVQSHDNTAGVVWSALKADWVQTLDELAFG